MLVINLDFLLPQLILSAVAGAAVVAHAALVVVADTKTQDDLSKPLNLLWYRGFFCVMHGEPGHDFRRLSDN